MLARLRRAPKLTPASEPIAPLLLVQELIVPTLHDQAEPVVGQVEQDLRTLISAVQQASAEVGRSVVLASNSLTDISARTAALVDETQTVDGTAALLAQAAKELTKPLPASALRSTSLRGFWNKSQPSWVPHSRKSSTCGPPPAASVMSST